MLKEIEAGRLETGAEYRGEVSRGHSKRRPRRGMGANCSRDGRSLGRQCDANVCVSAAGAGQGVLE